MSNKLIPRDQDDPKGLEEKGPESWQVESYAQWP